VENKMLNISDINTLKKQRTREAICKQTAANFQQKRPPVLKISISALTSFKMGMFIPKFCIVGKNKLK